MDTSTPPHDRTDESLAEILDFVVPLNIRGKVIADLGEISANADRGDGHRRLAVSLESGTRQNRPPAPNWLSRLRDLAQDRDPLTLDSLRQIVNKFVRYRAPRRFAPGTSPDAPPMDWEVTESAAPVMLVGMYWLDVGGAEAFAIEAAKLAATLGFRIVIVCDHVGRHTWLPRVAGFVERIYVIGKLDSLTRNSVCFKLICHYKPRLIHIHHCQTLYNVLLRLRQAGFRQPIMDTTHIVENRHGGYVEQSLRHSPWLDYHHVISVTLAAFYYEAGVDPEKIRLGYLCHETPHPRRQVQRGNTLIRLGFIGRFTQQKRPYLFVELARRLHAMRPGVFSFEMIGDGPLGDLVRNQIRTSHAPIILHPPQASVPDFLSRTDLLIICSDVEGLTLVAFEAIARHCVVVSTEVGSQGELIESPMLLPIAPFAFLRAATALLLRICDENMDIARFAAQQRERYLHLCSAPAALEICGDVYTQAMRGQSRCVA